jgi:hypothetical protein
MVHRTTASPPKVTAANRLSYTVLPPSAQTRMAGSIDRSLKAAGGRRRVASSTQADASAWNAFISKAENGKYSLSFNTRLPSQLTTAPSSVRGQYAGGGQMTDGPGSVPGRLRSW